jgi:hypothetical protein
MLARLLQTNSVIVVVGCAALAAVALAWAASRIDYAAHFGQKTSEQSSLLNPGSYKPNCEIPADREEADLCAQREMAVAARDLYWINLLQLGVAAFGTMAILWSLTYTRHALVVAREAMQVEREIGEAQVRAYLVVSEPRIGFNELQPIFRLKLRNSGSSPAMFLRATCSMSFAPLSQDGAAECKPAMLFVGGLSPGEASNELLFRLTALLSDHPTARAKMMTVRIAIELAWTNAFHKEDGAYATYLVTITKPLDENNRHTTIFPEGMTLGPASLRNVNPFA